MEGWSIWKKLLNMKCVEKAVEGLERGFYGSFTHPGKDARGDSQAVPPHPLQSLWRMEAGEASQSCNIPIPEFCVLQRGPGLHEKCPERGEPQTENSEQGVIPKNTGLQCQRDWMEKELVPPLPLENREPVCSVLFFLFFSLFSLWLLPQPREAK